MIGGESVSIERRQKAGEDQWGNPVWSTTVTNLDDCLIAWGSTSTAVSTDRTLISTGMTAYLPHGTEVLDGDIFIVRGERFKKNGEAQNWETPVGFLLKVRVVVALDRAEG